MEGPGLQEHNGSRFDQKDKVNEELKKPTHNNDRPNDGPNEGKTTCIR